jgi:hypothetical protein
MAAGRADGEPATVWADSGDTLIVYYPPAAADRAEQFRWTVETLGNGDWTITVAGPP